MGVVAMRYKTQLQREIHNKMQQKQQFREKQKQMQNTSEHA